ncbi:hypothetical protein MRB53_041259 [Persea americana]|nr:hypothetical protein MRB53_041259 [Persea americana]
MDGPATRLSGSRRRLGGGFIKQREVIGWVLSPAAPSCSLASLVWKISNPISLQVAIQGDLRLANGAPHQPRFAPSRVYNLFYMMLQQDGVGKGRVLGEECRWNRTYINPALLRFLQAPQATCRLTSRDEADGFSRNAIPSARVWRPRFPWPLHVLVPGVRVSIGQTGPYRFELYKRRRRHQARCCSSRMRSE